MRLGQGGLPSSFFGKYVSTMGVPQCMDVPLTNLNTNRKLDVASEKLYSMCSFAGSESDMYMILNG